MPEQRNLILAIVLSVTIILAFQYFYELPRIKRRAAPAGPAHRADSAGAGRAGRAPRPCTAAR